MPQLISSPSVINAAGTKPKIIEEFFGRVNSQTSELSIAKMQSPSGWEEPGQRPESDEFTIVLNGTLVVKSGKETYGVNAGQGILVRAGEHIQYSTPGPNGAEYIAVCLPAFSPQTVHRDDE